MFSTIIIFICFHFISFVNFLIFQLYPCRCFGPTMTHTRSISRTGHNTLSIITSTAQYTTTITRSPTPTTATRTGMCTETGQDREGIWVDGWKRNRVAAVMEKIKCISPKRERGEHVHARDIHRKKRAGCGDFKSGITSGRTNTCKCSTWEDIGIVS